MTQYAYMIYHRTDDNMFLTCLKTLRKNSKCTIVILTDNVPEEMQKELTAKYEVEWINVSKMLMKKRRAACKIEQLQHFVDGLDNGDEVLVMDVDIYFLADPFTAFEILIFDVALTTRGYDYHCKINAGVFYLSITDKTREWLRWHVSEVLEMKWEEYAKQNKDHRLRFGLDWAVGQDFLIVCWENRKWIETTKGIVIKDVGPNYNYCPPSDRWGLKAFEAVRKAYLEKSVTAIHLKSTLKDMLYEGLFEDAVTTGLRCSNDWYTEGNRT